MNTTDNKTGMPLQHYLEIYKELDASEIAQRCGLEFNSEKSAFIMRLLGTEYFLTYPEFSICGPDGNDTTNPYEKILVLRYLCEGKFFPSQGKQLSYNEFPWGDLYYSNFEGRCLKRCAFTFGKDISAFVKMIERNPQLGAESVNNGDVSYRLEFINGLYITIILWQGDDEFPPSAQILFDDNFVFAFTAEDLAVVGDVLIGRLKGML